MKRRIRNNLENGLPDDLCKWVSPAQLGAWTEELIGSLNWENPELQALLRASPEFRPKLLVRVLTLAYARGLSDSQGIVDECATDPAYQEACGCELPSAEELIAFRDRNRPLLEWMLGEVMKRAVKERYDCVLLPQSVKRYITHLASLRLDRAELADSELLAA